MPTKTNQLLLASGLTEVALGALTGWPYAMAIADADRAQALGIRSTARLRQWHLDLIALGGLTALASATVDDLPRGVAFPRRRRVDERERVRRARLPARGEGSPSLPRRSGCFVRDDKLGLWRTGGGCRETCHERNPRVAR